MKKLFLYLVLLAALPLTAYPKVWTLSDPNLNVQFDDLSLLMTVTDKRCSKVWEQIPLKDTYNVKKISQKGNTLNLSLSGKYTFNVTIRLSEASDLEVTLSANAEMPINEFTYPSAFKTPDKNHYLLLTDGEGYLLAADDNSYPIGRHNTYSMAGGLSMPWLGITDNQFETGYMAILDTPNDAAFFTKRTEGLIAFEPIWRPQVGKFGYDRKLIYHFFDKGGYVAQCKEYRKYAWRKNDVVSLRDNQKKFPSIEKMVGAVHIYVWDQARQMSFAKELKQSGITKAFILWNPSHNPYPVVGYDDSLKNIGYASGTQDLWWDILPRDSIKENNPDRTDPIFLNRWSYPGMFRALTVKDKNGSFDRGDASGFHICPKAILPLIPSLRADKEYSLYPHEGWFVDVYLSKVLYECYDKNHPLTRTQYKEAVLDVYKLFSDRYKVFTGAEWGADYGVSKIVFAHGMMTLHRTWFDSDAWKPGNIYYIGDWRNNSRPSQMISESTATDRYLKYSINEYTRLPLYELVYHDAIVTSWRWEDTNHKMPEIWWKKDLFNILYGNAPLWCLDQQLWRNYKTTFIESYNNVCPWLQRIGYDEMVSHRFVSQDHKVQETVFSSGQRAIVNFGGSDYSFEGKTIKAKGFLLVTN